jgi:hypothetical protein
VNCTLRLKSVGSASELQDTVASTPFSVVLKVMHGTAPNAPTPESRPARERAYWIAPSVAPSAA